jgi:hypothetical protein
MKNDAPGTGHAKDDRGASLVQMDPVGNKRFPGAEIAVIDTLDDRGTFCGELDLGALTQVCSALRICRRHRK